MGAGKQKQNVVLIFPVNLILKSRLHNSSVVYIILHKSANGDTKTITGHTPMREMVEKYETVLVVGGEGEKCRMVAEGYGFRDVITPGDIIKDNEATTPFRKLTAEERANSRKRDYGNTKIEAIL